MELNRTGIIDRLKSGITTINDFNYDKLTAPPLSMILSQYDIDSLYNIATSVRYSGNTRKKYKAIDEILTKRDFAKLSAGTNRLCYKFLHDDSFVIKAAYDSIAIQDSPAEFKNQFILKPFCSKVFEVDPCGVVGSFERVDPITSREEFASVAEDAFELIDGWLLSDGHIMADIGTKYFMNYGLRRGFGLVVIDFPYLYEIDGNKLFCTSPDNNSELGICNGIIDFDAGRNGIYCTKCGTKYRVKEITKDIEERKIIVKGGLKMNKDIKVKIMVGGVDISGRKQEDGFRPAAAKIDSQRNVTIPKPSVPRAGYTKPVVIPKTVITTRSQNQPADNYTRPTQPDPNEGTTTIKATVTTAPAETTEKLRRQPPQRTSTPVPNEDHRGKTSVGSVSAATSANTASNPIASHPDNNVADDSYHTVHQHQEVTKAEEEYVASTVVAPSTNARAVYIENPINLSISENDSPSKIIERIESDLSAAMKEKEDMETENKRLVDINMDIRAELEQCKLDLHNAEDNLIKMTAERDDFKNNYDELFDINNTNTDTINRYKVSVQEFEETMRAKDETITLANNNIAALQAEVDAVNHDIAEKDQLLQQLRTDNETLTDAIQSKDGEIKELCDRLESVDQMAIENINTELAEANAKISELEKRLTEKQAALQVENAKVKGTENRINSMQTTIDDLQKQLAEKADVDLSAYVPISEIEGATADFGLKIQEMELTVKKQTEDVYDFCDFAFSINNYILTPNMVADDDFVPEEIPGTSNLDATIVKLSNIMNIEDVEEDKYIIVFRCGDDSLLSSTDGKYIIASSIGGVPLNDLVLDSAYQVMNEALFQTYFAEDEGAETEVVVEQDEAVQEQEVTEEVVDAESTDTGEN